MSATPPPPGDEPIRDLVTVGFGPSNLALAIALESHNQQTDPDHRLSAVFLEARDEFSWHPGMLIPGATMQISFLKDLVTLRDPQSPYTFVNYLTERGRLVDFVNRQTFFPSRIEFFDYLSWAARRVRADVRYSHRVTSVDLTADGDALVVTAAGRRFVTRNVVFGQGLVPALPETACAAASTDRVFHSQEFLHRLPRIAPDRAAPRTFVVVGAGQSAAECVGYLHEHHPTSDIHAVFSKYGYTPADDSPYANRVFDPDAVDDWYGAPQEVRDRMFRYHRSTNYSAVDLADIEALYEREYAEKVAGSRRLHIWRAHELCSLTGADDVPGEAAESNRVRVSLRDLMSGRRRTLPADAVVLATGLRPRDPGTLLGPGAARYSATGPVPDVSRDYRLRTVDHDVTAGVYFNGGVEHTHGLTSSLLSNLAARAADIVGSVFRHERQRTALTPAAPGSVVA